MHEATSQTHRKQNESRSRLSCNLTFTVPTPASEADVIIGTDYPPQSPLLKNGNFAMKSQTSNVDDMSSGLQGLNPMTINLDQTAPARTTLVGRRTKMLFLAYAIFGLGAALFI
jgi:hypothetical protein